MTLPAEKLARLKLAFQKARKKASFMREEARVIETIVGAGIGSRLPAPLAVALGAELYARGFENMANGMFASAMVEYGYDLPTKARFDAWIEKLEKDTE